MNERAKTCLLVLAGLPGAGKSTIAKGILDHLSSSAANIQATHVHFDDFYNNNDATKFNMDEWKRARDKALETIESHLTAPSTSHFCLIIADDTFHLRSMRIQARTLARKHQAAHIQLYIDTFLNQALLQNKGRPNPLPDHIIITAALHTMQSPASSSLPWDSKCLKYSEIQALGSNYPTTTPATEQQQIIMVLWNVIWKEWGPPLPPAPDPAEVEAERDQARQATAASTMHQLDITLRSMVGKVMAEWTSEHVNNKQYTKELEKDMNQARRLLLTKVRRDNGHSECDRSQYIVMEFAQQQESMVRRYHRQLQRLEKRC